MVLINLKYLANSKSVRFLSEVLPNVDFSLMRKGGDGTAGSVLSYVNSESFREGTKFKMPVGILPLGTGNDLSI